MEKKDYQQIFETHRDKIWRFAMRILEDKLLAEDVMQDVLIRCWKHENELAGMDNPGAWMMRVTRNLCIDKIRKMRKVNIVEIDNAYSAQSENPTPLKSMVISDLMDSLKKLIDELPSKQKMVFHLREIEGMAYQEIGEILDMTLADVKVNLHRARKKIQLQLTKVDSYGLSE